MKASILFIFALFLLITCKEDCLQPDSILGEWEWVRSVGTWGTVTPESIEETKSLSIDDFFYRMYINDSLIIESHYDVIIAQEPIDGYTHFIKIEHGDDFAFGIQDCELRLTEYQFDDGNSHYYKKK